MSEMTKEAAFQLLTLVELTKLHTIGAWCAVLLAACFIVLIGCLFMLRQIHIEARPKLPTPPLPKKQQPQQLR